MTDAPSLFPCPCCGYLSFDEAPGSYNICEVCSWEDDAAQLRWPHLGGANRPLIIEQRKFAEWSATANTHGLSRDPLWRPVDLAIDHFEPPPAGNYFDAVCFDIDHPVQSPYYWRRGR